MKEYFKIGITVLILMLLIVGASLFFGFAGNLFDATVTKQHMNIERNNFEQSKSYVDGMIQELEKEKREYDQSTDIGAKQTILNYISSNFASFDASKITDPALYQFLMKARGE